MSEQKWIYGNSDDNTCRFVLGTHGERPLICFGVNPSTAEPKGLDPTMKSVDRIATHNNYKSWIMLNLYPQRATDPEDMDTDCNAIIVEHNLDHIDLLLSKHKGVQLWAAWGTNIETRPYLYDCLHKINQIASKYSCKWVCFGNKTKNGHPHHPLYLKKESEPETFDIESYLNLK